jgi:hypothetical protein
MTSQGTKSIVILMNSSYSPQPPEVTTRPVTLPQPLSRAQAGGHSTLPRTLAEAQQAVGGRYKEALDALMVVVDLQDSDSGKTPEL